LGLAAGCGGGSNLVIGVTPTPTRTLTATPTRTPTPTPTTATSAATVNGLVVVGDDLAPTARNELGLSPADWGNPADEAAFGRALANADYRIAGYSGTTGADGAFTITNLPPGRYTLELSKTIAGNLIPANVPIVVGDDGATVIAELGLGLLRSTVSYTLDGVAIQEIRGPSGTWLTTHNGHIAELGDPTRVLTDSDGDGRFEPGDCNATITPCGTDTRICADGQFCQCISACPFCDNCELPGVCATRTNRTPYRCNADDTCSLPGDRCVCTCPECADCGPKVCVPSCEPISITSIMVGGPSQIVVGRQTQLYATAQLSDGTVVDVTYLVDWRSSDDTVAMVDSWGRLTAVVAGTASITAVLGDVHSGSFSIAVVARPTLQRIYVQNQSCYCGPVFFDAASGVLPPCYLEAAARPGILPNPSCSPVVAVGTTLQLVAIGEYADGSSDDITKLVQWDVNPAEVGEIDTGLFTARAAGTAKITAMLDGISSDATDIRVVTAPTLLSLSIYPGNWAYPAVAGGPLADASSPPCFDCGTAVTLLRGDELRFQATGHYDTNDWRDVTQQVSWRSNDTAVAPIADGLMQAKQAGTAVIDATLDGVDSNPVSVRVVDQATLQSLSIYQEGTDRVVAKADQRYFRASGFYDIGISRDVTSEAIWRSSNDTVGGFDTAGVFTGRAAGSVNIWAEVNGQRSNTLSLEVFESTELAYCDLQNVNRDVWFDDFNRVVLESDCAAYSVPGVVTLRYTVTETQPHGGIFDPCLDLYVYQGDRRIRTIREEGCGDPFLPSAAPGRDEAALKYQLRAFWDLKSDDGSAVEPGTYTIYGRFYLYYDPVVKIHVQVGDLSSVTPKPTRPPTPTATPVPDRSAALIIGSAVGDPGQQVAIEATLRTAGAPVAALQNDLKLAPGILIAASDSGKPSCKVDEAIDKLSTTFAFLPAGCQGVGCSGVRAVVVALDNVDPIPDGAVVYRCTVDIAASALGGNYPIDCSNAVASDPRGVALPLRCSPGAVRLQGNDTPLPTTPDVDGACYLGSTDCSGGSFFPTAQTRCCELWRTGSVAAGLSWCPSANLDDAGRCVTCASSPCDGMAPRPPTP
jgi:uncharacterized protein YjdB